jgi:uncharacterized repeat protein (TIGR01451 family)
MFAGCAGGGGSKPSNPVSPANNPVPTINSLSPASVLAGSPVLTAIVTGTGYITSTTATLNGVPVQASYVSGTNLRVTIPASSLAAGQVADFVVSNPSPGGGTSAAVKFSIMSPTPTVSGVSPRSVPQGLDALVTVSGSGFEANSVVLFNGSQRPTTFVNVTTLQVALTANDVRNFGLGEISVYNPGPGGSTSTPTELAIAASSPTISGVNPSAMTAAPNSTVPVSLLIYGSGFAANATVQANGTPLPMSRQSGTSITASLAPSFFAAPGTIQVVVSNPGAPAVTSNVVTISVTAATASLSLSPDSAPAGSPDTTITLNGSGFTADSVVKWNDTNLATAFVNSRQVTAVIPASLISGFTQASIQVSTLGSTTPLPPQTFTTYLPLPTNEIVYNKADGLIYASVPGSVGGDLGNTIAAIDPNSGAIVKTIFVGSEPTKIALSSDGTQLFVGLNAAGAVRQVDLAAGTAGMQFSLGVATGIYNNSSNIAADLAVLPGQPNAVAVYNNIGIVTVYDSGVARPNKSSGLPTYFNSNYGSLSFGGSASTLYLNAQTPGTNLYALTIDSSGVTQVKNLGANASGNTVQSIQYDNNRIYAANGAVLNAADGTQLGQFSIPSQYTNSGVIAASGPMVSDSALGRAWVLPSNAYPSNNVNQIIAFDETTFNPVGSIPLTGTPSSPPYAAYDMIRWGQNGLAFRTPTQLFVLKSSLVRDLSDSPADLAVSISGPATVTAGNAATYTIRVANQGQDAASGVVLTTVLPRNVIGGTFNASQGACNGSGVLYCDFGNLANGGSATLTLSVTPTTAGSFGLSSYTSSVTVDPVSSNNQASSTITVTGSDFNASPFLTQIVPEVIQAGSSSTTLTVDGAGFVPGSSVLWNGQVLPTTFVSSGQMTATVDSSLVQQIGWAKLSVKTPAPGGGQSADLPLHIYGVLNVAANVISFDPFTRKLYAALPSTSSPISGNSILPIDPFTGAMGAPVQVGSEPNLLSETSDGKYLYIGLSGAKSIGRFNLLSQSLDVTVPLLTNSTINPGTVTNLAAKSIATLPGSDSALAVEIGGTGIFDITGSTGAFRANIAGYGDHAVFADSTHLYSFDSASSAAEFYRFTIDSTGAHYVDGTTLNGIGGSNGRVTVDSGLVFGAGGGLVDPATTPPSQIGVLAINNGTYPSYGGGVIPYQAEAKAFVFGVSGGNTSSRYMERFDTKLFTLDDRIQLPAAATSTLMGVRFGQDGLAYIIPAPNNIGIVGQGAQIFLFRGPFVLPAELGSNAVPVLSSVDRTSITAGTGNLYLTVTGTGFLPGAAVHWNGAERTTTYTDNTHLQVAISAADLSTPRSNSVTVQNPGSSDSNALSVQVQ